LIGWSALAVLTTNVSAEPANIDNTRAFILASRQSLASSKKHERIERLK